MYVNGFVLAVPADKKDAYRDVAEKFWDIARDYGAKSQVECWEADVPGGKTTDFRRAVECEDGEKIVFSWVTWDDKETADASHDKMMADERMKTQFGAEDGSDMPFDGKRMIYGGFDPVVSHGEPGNGDYVQGFVIPVPEGRKDDYFKMADEAWAMFRGYGATSVVEAWGNDVPDGKRTDFYRAVKAEPGEKVVFSWMTWPDRATCDAAAEKMQNDPEMKMPDDMPFDGKRMVYGGFAPLVWKEA